MLPEAIVQRIGFVVFADFQVMGFAAITAFEVANLTVGEPVYDVSLLSESGGLVRASAGFCVETEAFGESIFDTLIVGASARVEAMTPGVLAFVQRSMRTSRRVAGPCTGAFVLPRLAY